MSCSKASNVPKSKEPKCFVSTGDPQALVNKLFADWKKIADVAFKLLSDKFESICDQLRDLELSDLITRVDDYLKQLLWVQFGKIRHQRHQELLSYLLCR